jgi:hypothetical protein
LYKSRVNTQTAEFIIGSMYNLVIMKLYTFSVFGMLQILEWVSKFFSYIITRISLNSMSLQVDTHECHLRHFLDSLLLLLSTACLAEKHAADNKSIIFAWTWTNDLPGTNTLSITNLRKHDWSILYKIKYNQY